MVVEYTGSSPSNQSGFPLVDGAVTLRNAAPFFWQADEQDGLLGGIYQLSLNAQNLSNVNDISTLRIIKRPSSGGSWMLSGSSLTNTGTTNNPTVIRSGMSGFSQFTIAGTSENPLSTTTTIWDGTSWSNGSPDATTDAIVNANLSSGIQANNLTVNAELSVPSGSCADIQGTLANNSAVRIASGASLIAKSTISGSGNYFISRTGYSGNRYNLWSSPISGVAVGTVGSEVYFYNEPSNDPDYRNDYQTATATMQTAQGYAGIGGGNVTFSGNALHTGDKSIVITRTPSANSDQDGWNLIGNPYSAAYPIAAFLSDNSSDLSIDAVYFWNDDNTNGSDYSSADFAVYNAVGYAGGGSVAPDGYVPSCQGFFVKSSNFFASRTIDFYYDNVECNNLQFFRLENLYPIGLAVYQGEGNATKRLSKIIIAMQENATDTLDKALDAPAAFGQATLSSRIDKEMLIQVLPVSNITRKIDVIFRAPTSGIYTLGKDDFYLPEGMSAILEDKIGFAKIDLSEGLPYTFEARSDDRIDRFELKLVPMSTTGFDHDPRLALFPNPASRTLNLTYEGAAAVRVLDVLGKEVAAFSFRDSYALDVSGFAKGVYLVEVIAPEGKSIRRVVVE